MTLRHLQIFIKVFENQSITKAAQELYLAQPAVSLAIKELEDNYGIILFERMNRRIYPTNEAKKFYEYVIHIMDLFHQMEEETKQWENEGLMKIGSSITNSHYVLPLIIKDFKRKYPNSKIQLYIHNSEILENKILENKIDIAIIETDIQDENIIKIPFMNDNLTTIVPCQHPLTKQKNIQLDDLLHYPFFAREQGSSVTQLVKGIFEAHQLPLTFAMESHSTQAIIKHVEYGLGIATLPSMLVKQALDKQTVEKIYIPELDIQRQYHIIYHKHKYISKMMQEFISICRQFEINEK